MTGKRLPYIRFSLRLCFISDNGFFPPLGVDQRQANCLANGEQRHFLVWQMESVFGRRWGWLHKESLIFPRQQRKRNDVVQTLIDWGFAYGRFQSFIVENIFTGHHTLLGNGRSWKAAFVGKVKTDFQRAAGKPMRSSQHQRSSFSTKKAAEGAWVSCTIASVAR